MGTSPILTYGFGSWGGVNLLPLLGFSPGTTPVGGGGGIFTSGVFYSGLFRSTIVEVDEL